MRNSSVSVTVVTFTEWPLLCAPWTPGSVFGFAFACLAVEDEVTCVGVEIPLGGPESGACWRSFPCSVIRAGPSLASSLRSCGKSFERTKSFTGCLLLASE